MIYIAQVSFQRLVSPDDNPMHEHRKVYDLGEFTLRGKDLPDLILRVERALTVIEDLNDQQ